MMMRSDYATEEEALARSAEILEARVLARGGEWRPSGVADDGFKYLAGEWPGEPVGHGRHARPEIGIASYGALIERGAGRLDGRYLVEDAAGQEVSEDEIKRPEPEDDDVVLAAR